MANPGHSILDDHERRLAVTESRIEQHVLRCYEVSHAIRKEFSEMRSENIESHKAVLAELQSVRAAIEGERSARTSGWIKVLVWIAAGLLSMVGFLLVNGQPWIK